MAKRPATKGSFVKGDPRINRKGHPKGQPNFNTDFDEAVKKLQVSGKNLTVSEARQRLIRRAFEEADKGDYHFFDSLSNRIYGKPKETIDMNVREITPFDDLDEDAQDKRVQKDKGAR